jgi:ankyrin repeat protein
LGAGTDPNATDRSRRGLAPLHIACINRNWAIMLVVLEHGADPNGQGFSQLHLAIRDGAEFAVVEEMLKWRTLSSSQVSISGIIRHNVLSPSHMSC